MDFYPEINQKDARRKDASLPVQEFSLDRFIKKARGIRRDREGTLAARNKDPIECWTEFGVAGIHAYSRSPYRAKIDLAENYITENWLANNQHQLQILYDYDSVLGRSDNLPYESSIEVFPIGIFGFKLTKSVHIGSVPLDNNYGRPYEEFHIPHICLGTAGNRHIIRLILPGAINHDIPSDRSISPTILAAIYDDCMYPAVIESVGSTEAGHWLPTYDAEMKRLRLGTGGKVGKSGRLIPQHRVRRFGRRLLEKLNQKPWGRQAYFFHELRGIRGATQHTWEDREAALDDALSLVDQSMIDHRKWWVDVGTEIQCPGFVLWWRTDAHKDIISEALGIDSPSAEGLMRNCNKYFQDSTCHLQDIGGFRFKVPSSLATRTGHFYIQAYNTEKEAIYRLHGNSNAPTLEYKDVILNRAYRVQTYTDSLSSSWNQIRRKFDGHARVEFRINLAKLQEEGFGPIINISNEFLIQSLCAIPGDIWWQWKILRLTTMAQAIRWWQEASRGRAQARALSLVICLIYMINGLTSRSAELPAEKDIHELMIRDLVEEDDNGRVINPLGVIFPSSVIVGNNFAPRLGPNMEFADHVFLRLLNGRSLLSLQMFMAGHSVQTSVQAETEIHRVSNQKPRLQIRHKGATTEEEQIDIPDITQLSLNNQREPGEELQGQLSREVSNLVARSFMDLLLCSPNPKGAHTESYCKLSEKQRREATSFTFSQPNLAAIWNKCIVFRGNANTWDEAFRYLFPAEVKPNVKSRQNYKNCQFWVQWQAIMGALRSDARDELQNSVREHWNKLAWMPWPRSDRIWLSVRISDDKKIRVNDCCEYPRGLIDPAPVIITNPHWMGEPVCFEPQN